MTKSAALALTKAEFPGVSFGPNTGEKKVGTIFAYADEATAEATLAELVVAGLRKKEDAYLTTEACPCGATIFGRAATFVECGCTVVESVLRKYRVAA